MPMVPATGKKKPVEESCATFQRDACPLMWDSRGQRILPCRFGGGEDLRPDETNRAVSRRRKKACAAVAPRRIQPSAIPCVPKVPTHEQQRDRQFVEFLASLVFPGTPPGIQFVAFFLVNPARAIYSPLRRKSAVSKSTEESKPCR